MVMIFFPINEDSINEAKKVGFPLNPQAKGVLFLYRSNEDFRIVNKELQKISRI